MEAAQCIGDKDFYIIQTYFTTRKSQRAIADEVHVHESYVSMVLRPFKKGLLEYDKETNSIVLAELSPS